MTCLVKVHSSLYNIFLIDKERKWHLENGLNNPQSAAVQPFIKNAFLKPQSGSYNRGALYNLLESLSVLYNLYASPMPNVGHLLNTSANVNDGNGEWW